MYILGGKKFQQSGVKIETSVTETNGGSRNFQSHVLVGMMGMTDWIRESVITMAIGQKP